MQQAQRAQVQQDRQAHPAAQNRPGAPLPGRSRRGGRRAQHRQVDRRGGHQPGAGGKQCDSQQVEQQAEGGGVVAFDQRLARGGQQQGGHTPGQRQQVARGGQGQGAAGR